MYALVDIKGKQYKAETGALLKVDLLDKNTGETLEFASVMLVSGEQGTKVGQPYLPGVTVKAVVQEHGRDGQNPGVQVQEAEELPRPRGHRQSFTLLKVQEIAGL